MYTSIRWAVVRLLKATVTFGSVVSAPDHGATLTSTCVKCDGPPAAGHQKGEQEEQPWGEGRVEGRRW